MSLLSSHQYLPKALGAVMALALGAPLMLASVPVQAQYYIIPTLRLGPQ